MYIGYCESYENQLLYVVYKQAYSIYIDMRHVPQSHDLPCTVRKYPPIEFPLVLDVTRNQL